MNHLRLYVSYQCADLFLLLDIDTYYTSTVFRSLYPNYTHCDGYLCVCVPRRAIIESQLEFLKTASIDESICIGSGCQELPECANRLTTPDFECGLSNDTVTFEPMLLADNTPKITDSPYEHFQKWFHNSEGYNKMSEIMMTRIRSTDSSHYEYIKFVFFPLGSMIVLCSIPFQMKQKVQRFVRFS